MPWKWRGTKLYFYRNERIGNRVVSHYCGPAGSEYAQLWSSLAALDKERTQQERAERRIARAALTELASTPPELVELLAEAKRATAEALEAAGYHQHKRGEWRKKRGNKDKNEESPST